MTQTSSNNASLLFSLFCCCLLAGWKSSWSQTVRASWSACTRARRSRSCPRPRGQAPGSCCSLGKDWVGTTHALKSGFLLDRTMNSLCFFYTPGQAFTLFKAHLLSNNQSLLKHCPYIAVFLVRGVASFRCKNNNRVRPSICLTEMRVTVVVPVQGRRPWWNRVTQMACFKLSHVVLLSRGRVPGLCPANWLVLCGLMQAPPAPLLRLSSGTEVT